MKKDSKTILFIFGTRPEAIKMAPLIRELRAKDDLFKVKICLTGQHRQMLDQINDFFGISGDYDLNVMSHNQTLFDITARCITGLNKVLESACPDLVFVQGDTTTVNAGALASFYKKIPVAHLEAGLRSGDKYSPYPEEMNRIITSHIADYHFAPTARAVENLRREGIDQHVYLVGNTVIDALLWGLEIINGSRADTFTRYFSFLDFSRKIVLITGHRRENFGASFENICRAIAFVANKNKNVQFVYPMHCNPNVREPVERILRGLDNVFLLEPLDYPYMIWLLEKCYFVLTDSGGIQEEAPALGKPVLVMREVTERQEGVEAGASRLVGTGYDKLILAVSELLENKSVYAAMAAAVNPYGDGAASRKIRTILEKIFFSDDIEDAVAQPGAEVLSDVPRVDDAAVVDHYARVLSSPELAI